MRGFVRARSAPDCNSDATRLARESRESKLGAATQSPALTHGPLSSWIRRARCLIDRVQTLRFFAFASLVCCRYEEYVPVTSATTYSAPAPTVERDASGELPSTAEPASQGSPDYGALPFFPFFFPLFPIPQLDVGRGYEPRTQPIAPAYGPGGGR